MLPAWLGFIALVLGMLALDLGVFHRKAHVVEMREALAWSGVWIALALAFSVFIYLGYENHWFSLGASVDAMDGRINTGQSAVTKYLTGYIIEKSLSVDNLFVIATIFGALGVPAASQHRVLFWGVLGALLLRGLMIGLGTELVARYHWALYGFGAFLLFTAFRMQFSGSTPISPGRSRIVGLMKRWLPITDIYQGDRFMIHRATGWALTPLVPALVLVEATDGVFATDSIPATFAVTSDPFLVFTSNIFAILGLRSLFFALARMLHRFQYLKASLSLVLALVGMKMLAAHWLGQLMGPNFNFYLLGCALLILAGGVIASLVATHRAELRARPALGSAGK